MVRTRSLTAYVASIVTSLFAVPAWAQVQADLTLGTLVNNSPTAACLGVCEVTGGTVRGRNVFHSLRQFSLPSTNSLDVAGFILEPTIQNVFVRVTGESISNLNGAIITLDAARLFQPANFFLLNPNGIVLGRNGRILVGGAFLASTADRLLFPEGTFSTHPVTPPLLTVSTPIGLGFTNPPQPIRSNGAILAFFDPNNASALFSGFALVGGDVVLDGGGINMADSRIELGGLRSPGTVGFTLNQAQIQLAFPATADLADVTIGNLSGQFGNPALLVSGEGFGAIALHGRNITIAGAANLPTQALLIAGIDSNRGAPARQAGAITLTATNQINIQNTAIGSNVNASGVGNSGRIEIQADSIRFAESLLNVGQGGSGNAGSVLIRARDTVLLDNGDIGSNLGTRTGVSASGRPGEVLIEGKTIAIQNESQLQSVVFSGATAIGTGRVTLRAQSNISFTGGSAILTDVSPFAVGNGSEIEVQGRSLTMTDSLFSSSSAGQGNAGSIRVQADESVRLTGSLISSDLGLTDQERQLQPGGELARGQVGAIAINAPSILLENGGFITAAVLSGTATQPGVVSLQGRDIAFLNDDVRATGIFTNVFPGATGTGSDIRIEASRLTTRRADITTSSAAIGNAGNITLNVNEQLTLTRGTVVSSNIGGNRNSTTRAVGAVGTIAISAGDAVIDSSQIQAGFFPNASGTPGIVRLNARNSVIINNQSLGREILSGIFTNGEDGSIGDGSDIQISARRLSLLGYATLEAGSNGRGNAGSINLQIDESIDLDGDVSISSRLGTTGIGGGGQVSIATPRLSLNNTAEINVSSAGQGSAGNLNILAGTLTLDNDASIQSNARQGDGGNIFLRGDRVLLLRRNSSIETAAGLDGAGGDGGNIFIDFPFVVSAPNENNDIIANAFEGRGGQITINARNIYWFQPRDRSQLTQLLGTTDPRLLNPRRLPTNDITAFSQNNPALSGQVILNTPDLDPSRGLSALPVNLVDPSQSISQACQPTNATSATSRFVVTGRGGLPASPEATLTNEQPLVDLVLPIGLGSQPVASPTATAPPMTPPVAAAAEAIVEAQTWTQASNGDVYLVAALPSSQLAPNLAPSACQSHLELLEVPGNRP